MRLGSGTKKDNRKQLTEIASESFADHIITCEQSDLPVRMWYCGRKNTGIYSYRIVAAPRMILVYGDVGDYMLQASDYDLIPWLRGAVKSEHYVIGKMINKGEEFLPDEAEALLNELRDRYIEEENNIGLSNIESIRDTWDKDYDNLDKFAEIFMSVNEPTSLLGRTIDYESGVYWTMECLKKFIELLNNDDDSNTDVGICSSVLGLADDLNILPDVVDIRKAA